MSVQVSNISIGNLSELTKFMALEINSFVNCLSLLTQTIPSVAVVQLLLLSTSETDTLNLCLRRSVMDLSI